MIHRIHPKHLEDRALLDPECEECQRKTIAELDDWHLLALLGMTRKTLDQFIDPNPYRFSALQLGTPGDQMAAAALWAFRYQIRSAPALKIAAKVRALRLRGLWPLPMPVDHPWMDAPRPSEAGAEASQLEGQGDARPEGS